MSTVQQEAEIVENLSIVMRGKLRANAHKPVWKTATPAMLLPYVEAEFEELKKSIRAGRRPQDIVMECADMANMLAMIADVAHRAAPEDTK